MSSTVSASLPTSAPRPDRVALRREKVEGLRHGVVQLVVRDGRATQIERTETARLPADRDSSGRTAP